MQEAPSWGLRRPAPISGNSMAEAPKTFKLASLNGSRRRNQGGSRDWHKVGMKKVRSHANDVKQAPVHDASANKAAKLQRK